MHDCNSAPVWNGMAYRSLHCIPTVESGCHCNVTSLTLNMRNRWSASAIVLSLPDFLNSPVQNHRRISHTKCLSCAQRSITFTRAIHLWISLLPCNPYDRGSPFWQAFPILWTTHSRNRVVHHFMEQAYHHTRSDAESKKSGDHLTCCLFLHVIIKFCNHPIRGDQIAQ